MRHAALLDNGGRRLLIDTPPELRLQLLAARVDDIEAVWYTHTHADHTHGIDDLRVFSMRSGDALAVYGSQTTIESLAAKFAYVFDSLMKPIEGTFKPEGELRVLRAYEETEIAGLKLLPLPAF